MFTLAPIGEENASQNHLYDVILDKEYTLIEFINEVMKTKPESTGNFFVEEIGTVAAYNGCQLKLESKMKGLENKIVTAALAFGSIARANYSIQLESTILINLKNGLQPFNHNGFIKVRSKDEKGK